MIFIEISIGLILLLFPLLRVVFDLDKAVNSAGLSRDSDGDAMIFCFQIVGLIISGHGLKAYYSLVF